MTRIVRTDDGVEIDRTGKIPGRGAYLHDERDCWEKGLTGSIGHALKIKLSTQDIEKLSEYMDKLPVDSH